MHASKKVLCSLAAVVVGSYIVSIHSFRQPPSKESWEEPLFKLLPAAPTEVLSVQPGISLKHLCEVGTEFSILKSH